MVSRADEINKSLIKTQKPFFREKRKLIMEKELRNGKEDRLKNDVRRRKQ